MRILAIDPGFERLGIALIEKHARGREELLYSSCFRTSAKNTFPERLRMVGEEVEKIIKKYSPSTLAIETLFFTTNQKTAMRVAEIRGAILFIAGQHNLRIFEYTPLQIKVAITGYGKANKNQIMNMLPHLISFNHRDKKTDDELDAIAIGLTHCAFPAPACTEHTRGVEK